VLRPIAGPAIHNLRGDALDLPVQALLRLQGRVATPLGNPDPSEARGDFERGVALASPDPEPLDVEAGEVQGAEGPRPSLTYRPPQSQGTLVYFHGGGWGVGSPETHDPLCRRLALMGHCTVVSVDYRLAPEHPFPAGLDDALASFDDVQSRADGPVAVGGDSAGGNLSAVLARHRDPALQLLIYPATDLRRLTASYHELKRGFMLEEEAIDRYLEWYGADPLDPDASPLLGDVGTAPAIVATAGFDPLRDEGEQYARKLRDAGVPTIDLRFSHQVHGFANMDGLIPSADVALAQIGHALRHVWARCDTV
jgi:acetyl esterase